MSDVREGGFSSRLGKELQQHSKHSGRNGEIDGPKVRPAGGGVGVGEDPIHQRDALVLKLAKCEPRRQEPWWKPQRESFSEENKSD